MGLKQGDGAAVVVTNTVDKGCYCCRVISTPKRGEKKKRAEAFPL